MPGLRPLVSTRFQVLFTPLFGVLFTFPSRYWFTIGLPGVFSLGGWCRPIPTGRLRPRGTQDTTKPHLFTCTGLSPTPVPASLPVSTSRMRATSWSYNPAHAVTWTVWANPLSLATTCGITIVFSSYAYLDVSVQRVRVLIRHAFSMAGCPIRKPPDRFPFADPRCLSQLVASFIASGSLGIPRVPLFTSFTLRPFCYRKAASWDRANQRTAPTVAFSIILFSSNMSKNSFHR